jgi:hypothetical protein
MVNVSFNLDVPDQFLFLLLIPMIIDLILPLHHNKINLKRLIHEKQADSYLFDIRVEILGTLNMAILGIERETIIHEASSHHIRVGVEESDTKRCTNSIVLVDQVLVIFAKSIFFEVS